jgi:hypothetical protein
VLSEKIVGGYGFKEKLGIDCIHLDKKRKERQDGLCDVGDENSLFIKCRVLKKIV